MADSTPPRSTIPAERFAALELSVRLLHEKVDATRGGVVTLLDLADEQTPIDVEVKTLWAARETTRATVRDVTRDPWVRRAIAVFVVGLTIGGLGLVGISVDLPGVVAAARGVECPP